MSEGILIDNDIIIKISAYSLGAEMLHSTTIFGIPPAILGVGRFVVRSRLKKNKNIVNNGEAEKSFSTISQIMTVVEPDEKEIDLAARLEDAASSLNLELDSGESQLLAILVIRKYRLLLTGDKRAIRAVANIPSHAIKKMSPASSN
jgi:predicted nucleic acid-binding protein